MSAQWLATRVADLLGSEVADRTAVAGGDICDAYRLSLADGRHVFAKIRRSAPAGFFAVEAAGLGWLGSVAGGVPVPAVLAVADDILVLDWVAPGMPSSRAAEAMGRQLAVSHAAGSTVFGADQDGFIGSLPLANRTAPDWPTFYAHCRVLPYLRLAVDRGALDVAGWRTVESLVTRLPELGGPMEPPSRIHGDLWSGNLLWGADGVTRLVDPAAHGGHRETDLAMLALFGAPHLARIVAAYDEVSPLAAGWQDRVPLHQLHPLLVHAALFGAGYGARAAQAAAGLLACRQPG